MKLVKTKVSQKWFYFTQMDKQEKKMEKQRRGMVNMNIQIRREPVVSQTREGRQR